jgi:predicted  nucleic acid-binding Zn-ribbon protein
MLIEYTVKLLIFLILVLFISQLNNISLYKITNWVKPSTKEGLDECSQNEKDELYKQKIKINEVKDSASKIRSRIKNLEKEIQKNEQSIRENEGKLKSVVEKSKQEQNKAAKQSESIKY